MENNEETADLSKNENPTIHQLELAAALRNPGNNECRLARRLNKLRLHPTTLRNLVCEPTNLPEEPVRQQIKILAQQS